MLLVAMTLFVGLLAVRMRVRARPATISSTASA